MNFESAKSTILALLKEKGKATNSAMLEVLCGDRSLFEHVREDLILNDLAKDKDGVGLVELGEKTQSVPSAPGSPAFFQPVLEAIEVDETQVFISYGHADAFEFASRLRNDLVHHGYKAWMDHKTLQGGTNWVIEIEMGIARSFALIAVLTPHSTRAGGWCPKEVLLAHNDGKHIIPVRPVETNIRSLLLVDLHQVDFSGSYEAGLGDLLQTLESYRLKGNSEQPSDAPVAGMLAPSPSREKTRIRDVSGIRPFNFAREISAYLDLFVGRRWLKEKVWHWLASEPHPVFVLIGEPGIGKSAIACWLSLELERRVISLHLCTSRNMRTLDPYEYVAALVRQLVEMLPGFDAALGDIDLAARRPSAVQAFEELVIAPLKAMPTPADPRLLIVDSLDEAMLQQGETILDVIEKGAPQLPGWLRLLATTRPEEPVLARIRGLNCFELDAARNENQQDVSDYLAEAAQQDELRGILGDSPTAIAQRLAELAHGNFLYARMAVQALQRGELRPTDLAQLSGGLEDFYARAFELSYTETEDYKLSAKPLLEVLASARGPLPLARVQDAIGVDEIGLTRRLQPLRIYLRRFLIEQEPHVVFSHKSLRDWLADPVRSGRFHIDPISGHRKLGACLLNRWSMDSYALRHLPSHLIAAEQWDDLIGDEEAPGPLTNLLFVQAKCIAGLVHDLVADYNHALTALPEFAEDNAWLEKRDAAMVAYNRALRDYAVVRSEWLQALESGKHRPEPSYPPIPDELLLETRQYSSKPSSDRARRLQQYMNFVTGNTVSLKEHPAETLLTAANSSDSRMVSLSAEGILRTRTLPWIRRDPCPAPHPSRFQFVRTLVGHEDTVTAIEISPDGLTVISGSADKTVRIWDLESGRCLKVMEGHLSHVSGISLTQDGLRAITSSYDNTLRIWDLESGQCTRSIEGESYFLSSVQVSRDGSRGLYGSADGILRMVDLESGNRLLNIPAHVKPICAVCVIPGDEFGATGSHDSTVRLWDLNAGREIRSFEGHDSSISSISVNPDGTSILSGSCDATLRLWDLNSGRCLRIIKGHTEPVCSVYIGPDGMHAVSASHDSTLRYWDLKTGECLWMAHVSSGRASSVRICPNGRYVISGGTDKTIRIWDLGVPTRMLDDSGHKGEVVDVSVFPSGSRALSGSDDASLRIWDLESGNCLKVIDCESPVRSMDLADDGRHALVAHWDYTTMDWDLVTQGATKKLRHTKYNVFCVRHCDNTIISAHQDGIIRIWDSSSGEIIRELKGHNGEVRTACIMPDKKLLISGGIDGVIFVWDPVCGMLLQELNGHTMAVLCVCPTPDGRRAVSAGSDKTIRIWDLRSGSCTVLHGHVSSVRSVCVCADGLSAISGGDDGTVRFWNLESGDCFSVFRAESSVRCVTTSPNQERIICGSDDGQVHFLTPVCFPPSGPVIVTARNANTIQCSICATEFTVPPTIADCILEHAVGLPSSASPCLILPEAAFGDPRLLATCPHCHGALKFNPFFSHNFA